MKNFILSRKFVNRMSTSGGGILNKKHLVYFILKE